MKPKHFEIELNCALRLSFTVIFHVIYFFFCKAIKIVFQFIFEVKQGCDIFSCLGRCYSISDYICHNQCLIWV